MQNATDTLVMPLNNASEGTLGQYALVREAGRGGMSVVHEARHTMTGRTVAVKMLAVPPGLPPQQARDMRARFEREARAAAGLSHPNIVAVHELGEQAGQPYLVMEYLRGETLRARLARGPLTPAQALPVLRQVADAVDAVHGVGLVHRDIKPSNVMLLPDGTAKLLDFGLARHDDDAAITSAGVLIGSPAYMDPEQVRGGPGTPASDVWALGALLYEMLAARPPFVGKSIASVLYQVTHEDPPAVLGLTAPVRRVLRRALDKNPARRYQSARALAEALAAAVASLRTRAPLRLGAAVALAVVSLLGFGFALLHDRSFPPARPPTIPPVQTASLQPAFASGRERGGVSAPPVRHRARRHAKHAAIRRGKVRHPAAHPQAKGLRPVRTPKAVRQAKHPVPPHRGAQVRRPKRPHPSALSRRKAATVRVVRLPPHAAPARRAMRPFPVRHMPLRPVTVRLSPFMAARESATPAAETPPRAAPPPQRRKRDDSDAAASASLQKFIWSVGR